MQALTSAGTAAAATRAWSTLTTKACITECHTPLAARYTPSVATVVSLATQQQAPNQSSAVESMSAYEKAGLAAACLAAG